MDHLLINPKICGECSVPGCHLKCSCKTVFYCGPKCQMKHWRVHKKVCVVALARKIRHARREHGQDNVVVALARLEAGNALRKQGRFGDAERCLLDADRICSEVNLRESRNNQDDLQGQIYLGLGMTYWDMDLHDEALKFLQKGLGVFRNTKGEGSQEVGRALVCIGDILHSRGSYEESLKALEEGNQILQEVIGVDRMSLADIMLSRGICYLHMGELDKARFMFEESLRSNRNNPYTLLQLGVVERKIGCLAKASVLFQEALGVARSLYGENHTTVSSIFNNLAELLFKQDHLDEALKMHKKAIKILRRVSGGGHADTGYTLACMGNILMRQGKHRKALKRYNEGILILSQTDGPKRPDITYLENDIAICKSMVHKEDKVTT